MHRGALSAPLDLMAGNQRFGKQRRLLNNAAFKRVFARSQRSSDALFTVRANYAQQPQARLGLAISKRHARHAVQRNRIKRCVREVFRQQADSLRHADYVVVNHPPAATASKVALQRSIGNHLARLGAKKSGTPNTDSA
ncbi:MAG: ribonuclease P protein component [Pseudomonadota bacterium]